MNCEQCHIGHYRSMTAPYLDWYDSQIMVVPHVPAYVCDVCGQMHYDANFINILQYLLDQFDDETQDNALRRRQAMPDNLAGHQPEGARNLVC
jgi:YgiT-type zinc finger domain-containing protein